MANEAGLPDLGEAVVAHFQPRGFKPFAAPPDGEKHAAKIRLLAVIARDLPRGSHGMVTEAQLRDILRDMVEAL